jgi:segregation and condensation protein B
MADDYSTPPSPNSGAGGWVKGNLPGASAVDAPRTESAQRAAPSEPAPKAPARAPEPDSAIPPIPAPNGNLSLEALVESLLFVADGPVPVARIAEALEVSVRDAEAALKTLEAGYVSGRRGLSLQRFRDKVQLTTAPAAADRVQRFLGLAATAPLSRAALETLAIVAYQQPVTRPQIEAVRGVNSDSVLKNLLGKGLIEEVGRTDGPGRPVLYATTPEFLQYFGLSALADLPPLNLEAAPAAPGEILKG